MSLGPKEMVRRLPRILQKKCNGAVFASRCTIYEPDDLTSLPAASDKENKLMEVLSTGENMMSDLNGMMNIELSGTSSMRSDAGH
ncbi:hypothetical protein PoHVEF18_006620 [Penicillium ochrochloron]